MIVLIVVTASNYSISLQNELIYETARRGKMTWILLTLSLRSIILIVVFLYKSSEMSFRQKLWQIILLTFEE